MSHVLPQYSRPRWIHEARRCRVRRRQPLVGQNDDVDPPDVATVWMLTNTPLWGPQKVRVTLSWR